MDIERLGTVIVEKLVDKEMVGAYADLYALHRRRDDLVAIEIEQQRTIKGEVKTIMVPLGEKRADTMLAGIEASKKRPLRGHRSEQEEAAGSRAGGAEHQARRVIHGGGHRGALRRHGQDCGGE